MASPESTRLQRTLGLPAAMAIGVGTMVGAGIFVFPGIAAGEAGPAASVSFALGAAVALLVALPASELATAIPRSGGAYTFASRALGPLAGTVSGVGQWLGLVFASAFYLVGFGEYAAKGLSEAGLDPGVPPEALALAASLVLTGVGLVGAEKTGGLQNALVGLLLAVLAGFLGYGALSAAGVVGQPSPPETFAPFGALPIFTTAALVFTSYLGFVQVATVAGEVRDPARNLPRAMVGSVVLVGLLYVGTLLVSVSVLGSERLGEMEETALVGVGRAMLGPGGALVILGCGLLATLSSANASIMSASRAVFALSRDRLAPRRLAAVNARFGTPHVSLAVAGGLTAGLILTGRTELLAQVASVLHLFLYALICLALLALRRRSPAWYRPSFTSPLSPWLPGAGAAASFGLVLLMDPLPMVIGGGLLLASTGLYAVQGRRAVVLPPPAPSLPSPGRAIRRARLVVVVDLDDPPRVDGGLARVLRALDLVFVGLVDVPRQTEPEQAREELGEEAEATLEEVAGAFRGDGAVETRTLFSGDPDQALDELVEESGCQALLFPRPVDRVGRVLVAVRAGDDIDPLATFVAGVARDALHGARLTVVHVLDAGESEEEARALVGDTRRAIVARGLRASRVRAEVVETGAPKAVLAERAEDHDLLVIGSSTREGGGLGSAVREIARSSERPVLVVRGPAACEE